MHVVAFVVERYLLSRDPVDSLFARVAAEGADPDLPVVDTAAIAADACRVSTDPRLVTGLLAVRKGRSAQ